MSPLGIVGAFFAITGILSLVTVAAWVLGTVLGWPPAVGMGQLRAGPVLVLLGAGVVWLMTAVELSRGRKRGGVLAVAGLVLGVLQTFGKGEAAAGALMLAAVCMMLLAWGWSDLESW